MGAKARGRTPLILTTELGEARGGLPVAAAVGVAASVEEKPGPGSGVLLAELGAERGRGPTMLASVQARELEERLRTAGFERVAARGRLCWLGLAATEEALAELPRLHPALQEGGLAIVHLPAQLWPLALDQRSLCPQAGLLRADLPADRALAALAVTELRERRLRARIAARPLGRVASRRAMAGLEVGGAAANRVSRLARGLVGRARAPDQDRGQALLMVLGAAFAILFAAAVLAALGGALTATARAQRAADLVALSGARSLRDDFDRLFTPPLLPGGAPNPLHLDRREYLARAAEAAREAATRNGVDPDRVRVSFPDAASFAPLRVRAELAASVDTDAGRGKGRWSSAADHGSSRDAIGIEASAEAMAAPPSSSAGLRTTASGGGYSGPLVYRQGEPMRPDVALAFDRMAAAARRAGAWLVINSAYRSDAEQARLYAEHPDPRWVAPPGQSLHRCGTELDLGPPSAYPWLAAHAPRFGFVRRYSWEPWHFGYEKGPAPCSPVGGSSGGGHGSADGDAPGVGDPSFVPARFRSPIVRAATRWDVSAGLLAAQLMAESNFNPFAFSAAGAQGIAQFMPATARAYGLDDPFDARAAIDAQARLMSDLVRQFGTVALALAAYNAGPAAVAACDCVPDYPETQAYVARVLGLMGGAGELAAPALEVRLVD
ncbi:MAG TPA: transglycosylase SLT domain-containing protein [Solirubrobacterales bacterium]|nr:transglycosylase SLT domain-containing protein [Solirubrobacterales bacterium]